jgi:hypothetical protein
MKSKQNIDEYTIGKVGMPSGKYSLEHWAAMESLLDQDDRKKRLLFWRYALLAGLFIVGIATSLVFLIHSDSDTKNKFDIAIKKVGEGGEHSTARKKVSINDTANFTNDNASVRLIGKENSSIYNSENSLHGVRYAKESNEEKSEIYGARGQDRDEFSQTNRADEASAKNHFFLVKEKATTGIPMRGSDTSITTQVDVFEDDILVKTLKSEIPKITSKKTNGEDSTKIRVKNPFSYHVGVYGSSSAFDKIKPIGFNHDISKSEVPLSVMEYGLYGGVQSGKWLINIGVSKTYFQEQTNYESYQYNYTHDTSYTLVSSNFGTTAGGKNLGLLKRTIESTVYDSISKIDCLDCLAKFSYINVPISVQYEVTKTGFKYFGEFGFVSSFLNDQSGLYTLSATSSELGTYYQVGSLTSDKVQKVLLQASAQVGLKYECFTRYHLVGSYRYQIAFNSMMKDYNQKLKTHGVLLGLEYSF